MTKDGNKQRRNGGSVIESREIEKQGHGMFEMTGFSPEFRDPEHYITSITYRIWEERGIERIREWYAPECVVRTPHGVTGNVDPVVKGTADTLSEFPDRQLLPEEIIIGYKPRGFYSSHRVRSTATHLGGGMFGPATGKAIYMLTIADCLCVDNQITEEWLVRDQAAMALQLGLDPVQFGYGLGKGSPERYAVSQEELEKRWAEPQGLSQGPLIIGDADTARRLVSGYEALWSGKDEAGVKKSRHRALRFEGPGGVVTYGRERMVDVLAGIIQAIPKGVFRVQHVIVRQDENRPVRGALRWSYSGRHRGIGRYGRATDVPLTILGLSHVELRDNQVVNEWMLMDDLAVYAQIAAWQSAG